MNKDYLVEKNFAFGIENGIVDVAFRSNGIHFINSLASLLPDDTPVIPMDNTAQGIYTIGDIKREIDLINCNKRLVNEK